MTRKEEDDVIEKEEQKFYDITYEGIRVDRERNCSWRDVIDVEPEAFIKRVKESEEKAERGYYSDFKLVSQREISKQGFDDFDGYF